MGKGPEARIQIQIVMWLRWQKYLVFAIPNRGLYRNGRYNIVDREFTAGIPDLEVPLSDGRTIRIEVKAPKGVVSDAQKIMLGRLMQLNHPCFVARSLDDVKNEFLNRGYKP